MKSKPALADVTCYCDALLQTAEFEDYSGAVNGLQVENDGTISKIAAAVDATLSTVKLAVAAGADLLIVHHGLFWSPSHPWTGRRYELITQLIRNNVAVYSSHLPLDAHPSLGNNAQLASLLGLKARKPFFLSHGKEIGVRGVLEIQREKLVEKLSSITNSRVHLLPGGKSACKRIGVVTGGAGAELKEAAKAGVDAFITGEGPHWTFALAEEQGINVFYAGHYATETFGVKALAAHLSKRYGVPWEFLDYPTGL